MSESAAERIRARLLGAWRLVSWKMVRPDGTASYPLGEEVVGQLTYDAAGRVSAQLVRADLPRLASDDWTEATEAERAAAWPGYFGYFGSFTVDAERSVVTHHVEGSWFANLAGTEQRRHYRFDGDLLVLDAETPWGTVLIEWQRHPVRDGRP